MTAPRSTASAPAKTQRRRRRRRNEAEAEDAKFISCASPSGEIEYPHPHREQAAKRTRERTGERKKAASRHPRTFVSSPEHHLRGHHRPLSLCRPSCTLARVGERVVNKRASSPFVVSASQYQGRNGRGTYSSKTREEEKGRRHTASHFLPELLLLVIFARFQLHLTSSFILRLGPSQ